MDRRMMTVALALASCLAAPAAGQDRPAPRHDGGWEVSLGTGATFMDASLRAFLGSGAPEYRFANPTTPRSAVSTLTLRAGYNISRSVGLSFAGAMAGGEGVTYFMPSAALTVTSNLNARTSPFLLAGMGFTRISGLHDRITHSLWGIHGGVGMRSRISQAVALRIEGLVQLEGYREVPMSKRTVVNPLFNVGFSYFIGGRSPPP